MAMKKGVVLTLSIVLMASAFLYLLAAISSYSHSIKEITIPLSDFEELNMQFDSAAYGARSILFTEGMSVSSEGTWLVFEEDLQIAGMKSYYSSMYSYKLFIENFAQVNTTVDLDEAGRPRLHIHPQEIEVDHPVGKVKFTPEDTEESMGGLDGYNVLIMLDEPIPRAEWETLVEVSENDSDAMYLHVGMQGNDGGLGETVYVGKHNSSELRLYNEQNQSIITIQVQPPAELTINYNVDIHLKTIVQLNSSSSVELGTDMISVDIGPNGKKTGKVIVHES
jgi:hypothetical protein